MDVLRPADDDIAAALGIATSRLERELRRAGATLAQEIKRLRIEMAQEALLGSDRKIADIGRALGYGRQRAFYTVFPLANGYDAKPIPDAAQKGGLMHRRGAHTFCPL